MNYKYKNINVEIQKVGLEEQECVDIILYDEELSNYEDIKGNTSLNRKNAVCYVMYSKKDLDGNDIIKQKTKDINWLIHSDKENIHSKKLFNLKNNEIPEDLILDVLIANEEEQIKIYKRINEVKFSLIAKKAYNYYLENNANIKQ
jgi:hypothetical protein